MNKILFILCFIFTPLAFSDASVLLDSYSQTNQDGYADWYATSPYGEYGTSQSFTTPNDGISYNLDKSTFYLRTSSSNSCNMVSKLYTHSGSYGSTSYPSGTALATSDTVNWNVLTSSFVLIDFTFSTPYTMDINSNYVITVETDCAYPTIGNIGYDSSSPTHSGSASHTNGGSGVWESQSYDVVFYVYGTDSEEELPIEQVIATTTIATTEEILSTISFGLTIIIVILFTIFIGYMYNSINAKKPWL